jgi:hypothetical protein
MKPVVPVAAYDVCESRHVNGLSYKLAERRKPSGEDLVFWQQTGRLAPLRYQKDITSTSFWAAAHTFCR